MFSFFKKKPPAQPAPAAPEAIAPTPPPAAEEPSRAGWLQRLHQGLRKTGSSIAQVFTGTQIDDALYEELEAALLMADTGVKATQYLLDDLKRRVREAKANDPQAVRALLVDALTELLRPLEKQLTLTDAPPTVMMVVGVNGAGKTTSIGKLAQRYKNEGRSVLLCAADTFRAAAIEQLEIWGERTDTEVIRQKPGADPSAVLFDALQAAKARKTDYVIIDTAGRLQTKTNLMAELEKMQRTAARVVPSAPHEVLLVLDATTGQNGLEQARRFTETSGVTGIILAKLDGTAKGGVVIAIARELNLPIRYVGVGEKADDLLPFDPEKFIQSLFEQ